MNGGRQPDPSARTRALGRFVAIVKDGVSRRVDSLVERVLLRSNSVGESDERSATTDDADEDTLEVLEQYGFASSIPAGALGIAIAVGADPDHRVVLGFESISGRPATGDGEVAVWAKSGAHVILKANGDIELRPKAGSKVYSGGTVGTEPVAKATSTRAELDKIITLLKTWTVVPNDGGQALKNAAILAFPDGAADVGSTTTEVV